jgi:glycosidase
MPDRSIPNSFATIRNVRRRGVLLALVAAAVLCAGLALPACSGSPRSGGAAAAPAVAPPAPPCTTPPIAAGLFLRGTMTNWALDDDYTFAYVCNEYVLNVELTGAQRFRIGDAASTPRATFGGPRRQTLTLEADIAAPLVATADGGGGDLQFAFSGPQTIHVRVAPAEEGAWAASVAITPRNYLDPAAAPVTDAVALGVRYDSRAAADKTPFGAITPGTPVHYSIASPHGVTGATLIVERRRLEGPQEVLEYEEIARVPMTRAAGAGYERWRADYRFDEPAVYGYWFEIVTPAGTFAYQNNHDSIYWTREKGSGGLGRIERGTGSSQRIRRFRQTVYRADYHVPDWGRDAVFYYIFPERFRNGDRRNDPRPGPRTFHDRSVEVHAHWLDQPSLPRSGDGSDDVYGNDFFGGDLAGITQQLDYIRRLGANTLYLTPIFRAASNHKYDTADYRHIDPHFGSDAEFLLLTRAARERGIRVLLDTSLNHTGSDSIYFDRWAKYPGLGAFDGGHVRPDSAYADWYRFDPSQSDPERQYRGWAGAQDLPELNKASPAFRAFAFGAPDGVMQHWLDRGASGWRMDVAPWVPDDFWRAWRSALKQHRPDALAVAETQFEASKFFLGDEFDSTMNYIFRNAVEAYANGADARAAYANIELMRELYPPQAFYALMNLLSTHDSPRALYDFGYRNASDDAATIALARQRLRLAVFFQMTFPGAPAVFYGDEAGVTGGEDPFNRVTYPWADLGGKPDRELLADYRRLIAMRHAHAILRHGSIDAPAYIDAHLIVLLRRDGTRGAITATNNDGVAHTATIRLPDDLAARRFIDVLGGGSVRADAGSVTFSVPPHFGVVLVSYPASSTHRSGAGGVARNPR